MVDVGNLRHQPNHLMGDSTSLDFPETAVRHSRHGDFSLHIIMQMDREFALTSYIITIPSHCGITLAHRVNKGQQNWPGGYT